MITLLRHCITGAVLIALQPCLVLAAEVDAQTRSTEFVRVQNLAEPSEVELAMWDFAVTSGDPEEIKRFLELFPDSQFAGDAEILIRALAPEPSPTTDSESISSSDRAAEVIVFDQATDTNPETKSTVS